VTLRRQIQTFEHSRWYNQRIEDTLRDFVRVYGVEALELEYESLVRRPAREIARIREFLEIDISVDDLREVYRGELHRNPKTVRDCLMALLVYAKNYRQRLRV
jgi:LPS sulfotransferase NodH